MTRRQLELRVDVALRESTGLATVSIHTGRDAEERVARHRQSSGHHLSVRGRAGLGGAVHGLGEDETGGSKRDINFVEGEVAREMSDSASNANQFLKLNFGKMASSRDRIFMKAPS